jgi:hypothetical protein
MVTAPTEMCVVGSYRGFGDGLVPAHGAEEGEQDYRGLCYGLGVALGALAFPVAARAQLVEHLEGDGRLAVRVDGIRARVAVEDEADRRELRARRGVEAEGPFAEEGGDGGAVLLDRLGVVAPALGQVREVVRDVDGEVLAGLSREPERRAPLAAHVLGEQCPVGGVLGVTGGRAGGLRERRRRYR